VRVCVFVHVTGCSASCIQYNILRIFSLASVSQFVQPPMLLSVCMALHACVFLRTAHIKLNINILNLLH